MFDLHHTRRIGPDAIAFNPSRKLRFVFWSYIIWSLCALPATGQDSVNGLRNGGFESIDDQGMPAEWAFPALFTESGFELKVDHDKAFEGRTSIGINSTNKSAQAPPFGNLMQSIDATPWRGKRVRFRAAVRVESTEDDCRGQLWFRVDLPAKNGQPALGAFDNMQDRPIKNEEWQVFEIVGDVDNSAERILVGLLCFGKGVVWIDAASLDEVGEAVTTTASTLSTSSSGITRSSSGEDPAQPFFNPWLWLVVTTIVLFVISQTPTPENLSPDVTESQRESKRIWPWTLWWIIKAYALRFAVVYWGFYSLTTVFFTILPYSAPMAGRYNQTIDQLVRWFAEHGLGIERTLIAPNGSGDTTFAYVQLLLTFLIAIAVAMVWTLVTALVNQLTRLGRTSNWRESVLEDLLRSYLRYALAFTMLSYGLAKTGWAMNQFPEPSPDRLLSTYGDSSPMGLVWTFMGASRTYTIFAGLGEVVGALLLIWRRTTTLGALVVVGVMSNVVMLNFCYDIPVKQYSAHLLAMAFFLLLPEVPRLVNLLVLNRAVPKRGLTPPYTNRFTIWVQRAIKIWIIVIGIAWPLWGKAQAELKYDPLTKGQPSFYGTYEVVSFQRDGNEVPALLTDSSRWRYVIFQRSGRFQDGQMVPVDVVSLRMTDGTRVGSLMSLSDDQSTLRLSTAMSSLPEVWKISVENEGQLRIEGGDADDSLQVTLRPLKPEDFLLTHRGFRWINEYPFNR